LAIWNFWRKSKDVTKNAKEYVEAAKKVSRPVALALAAVSFVLVFAAVLGLFMAGRWGWNKLREDERKVEQAAPVAEAPSEVPSQNTPAQEQPQSTPQPSTPTPAPSPQPTPPANTPTVIPNTGPDPNLP
jgi:hypothetical protein